MARSWNEYGIVGAAHEIYMARGKVIGGQLQEIQLVHLLCFSSFCHLVAIPALPFTQNTAPIGGAPGCILA